MKRLLIASAAAFVSIASYAQGTVHFSTRVPGINDAPVELYPGGPGPGDSWSAELVTVGVGGVLGAIPQSRTTFRTIPPGGNPALAMYVTPVAAVEIPGTTVGGSVTLRFRAFLTSAGSYDAADFQFRGSSSDFTVPNLGDASRRQNLIGVTGFVIGIPEPSTIALGVLGALALLLSRRNNSLFVTYKSAPSTPSAAARAL